MRIRKVFSDSILYGVTKYLTIIAGIFLTPIYTRLLTKADYGVMDVFNTWNMFVITLLPLGLTTAILRLYPDLKDVKEKKLINGTIFNALLGVFLIYSIIIVLARPWFFKFFVDGVEANEAFYLSIGIGLFSVYFAYFQNLLRIRLQVFKYVFVSVLNFLILSTLGFFLVYTFKLGIEGFFYASFVGLLVSTLLGYYFVKEEFGFGFSWSQLLKILKYSIHLLSAVILFHIATLTDRLLIVNFLGIEDLGIYAIGIKVAGFCSIALYGFTNAWFPIVMNYKNEADAPLFFNRVYTYYLVIMAILISGIIVFSHELLLIFAPDYLSSKIIIWIFCVNFLFTGLDAFFSIGLHTSFKSKIISYASMISVFSNLIFSLIFVHVIGLYGVAIGTLISTIIWVYIQKYYSSKYYPLKYNNKVQFAVFGAVGLVIIIMYFIEIVYSQSWSINVMITKSILVFFIIVMVILYFCKKNNINSFGNFIKRLTLK